MNKKIEQAKKQIEQLKTKHETEINNLKRVIQDEQEKIKKYESEIMEATKAGDLETFKKNKSSLEDSKSLFEMSTRKLELIKNKNEYLEAQFLEIENSIIQEQKTIYENLKKPLLSELKKLAEMLEDARSETLEGNDAIKFLYDAGNRTGWNNRVFNNTIKETNEISGIIENVMCLLETGKNKTVYDISGTYLPLIRKALKDE